MATTKKVIGLEYHKQQNKLTTKNNYFSPPAFEIIELLAASVGVKLEADLGKIIVLMS